MISSLTGRIAEILPNAVEVDVNGVGYLVNLPASTLSQMQIGKKVRLLTQMVVREDAMTIYGFSTFEDRDVFNKLTSVTGIGPRIAMSVLSSLDPSRLRLAVASGDIDVLTTVPGIGKKAAGRVIVELKEKLGSELVDASGDRTPSEVKDALVGLGYSSSEIRDALARIDGKDAPVEDLVRAALRELAKV